MSSPRAVKSQRAALLAIGDEVLRGEVNNTNAAFLAERLFDSGYELAEQVVVSDDPQAIRTALVRLRAEMEPSSPPRPRPTETTDGRRRGRAARHRRRRTSRRWTR
jgi:hypothetical protein